MCTRGESVAGAADGTSARQSTPQTLPGGVLRDAFVPRAELLEEYDVGILRELLKVRADLCTCAQGQVRCDWTLLRLNKTHNIARLRLMKHSVRRNLTSVNWICLARAC